MVWQVYFDDLYIRQREIPALSWTLYMMVEQHILNIASTTKSIGDMSNIDIFYTIKQIVRQILKYIAILISRNITCSIMKSMTM